MGKTIKLTIHETHILFPFLFSLSRALEVFWIFLSKVLLLDMGPIVPVQQQLFLGTSGDKRGHQGISDRLAEEKALSSQISMCIPGAEQHKSPPPDSDHQLPHTPSLSQALQKKTTPNTTACKLWLWGTSRDCSLEGHKGLHSCPSLRQSMQ